ncbi:MAG TPA: hypothetical protein DCS19_10410, partial [Flavobacterium sp.]|nr:hypothetical protein [Flavobacterium sp.]
MKITIKNYLEQSEKIDFKKTPHLEEGHNFFIEAIDVYDDDDTIKEAIDNHIIEVNDYFDSLHEEPKSTKSNDNKIIYPAGKIFWLKKDFMKFKRGEPVKIINNVTKKDLKDKK